jgi:hypothetical protein
MNTIHLRISWLAWGLGLVLAFGLIVAPTAVQAGRIGEQEVRGAVETWVRYVTADARPDAVIERMEPYQMDGEIVAYIAHLKGVVFACAAPMTWFSRSTFTAHVELMILLIQSTDTFLGKSAGD